MKENTPIFKKDESSSGKFICILIILMCISMIGICMLCIGAFEYQMVNGPTYKGICKINDNKLIFYATSDSGDMYYLIFNVTIVDDSAHPIDPDCCYTAIVYGNEVVYQYTGENLIEKYPVGSNTSCLYRDKNTKYPHKGDMSTDIWIGGGSTVADSDTTWIVLVVIGCIVTCLPCLLAIPFGIYQKYKIRKEPVPYGSFKL